MKTKKLSNHQNGHSSPQDLIAKAVAAQKLAAAARKHLKMLKAEHKLARKAFKQAKKAAKRAGKEAKAAAKLLKSKNGARTHHQKVKPVRRRSASAAKPATSHLRTPKRPIPLPANPAPSGVSVATA